MNEHLIELITIIIFSGVLVFLEKIITRRVHAKGEMTPNIWGKAILGSIRKPFHFFIWFTVVAFAIQLLQQMFIQDEMIQSLSYTLYRGGALFIFIWTIFRFINKFEHLAAFLKSNKYHTARVAQLLRVSAFVIGGICFLQLLDIPLSGLLAFGGIGGIALGFAAKDLFANFFGGFMIFLDQPFQIGDLIRSPNQEIEGTVEHIGWRLTRIRTPSKSLIFVPNTLFSTIVVDNFSLLNYRQIKTKLTLSYMEAAKAERVIAEIQESLKACPEIDTTVPFFANLMSFSPYGLEVVVQAYTKRIDLLEHQAVQQEIFLKILTILESHGATLAIDTCYTARDSQSLKNSS